MTTILLIALAAGLCGCLLHRDLRQADRRRRVRAIGRRFLNEPLDLRPLIAAMDAFAADMRERGAALSRLGGGRG